MEEKIFYIYFILFYFIECIEGKGREWRWERFVSSIFSFISFFLLLPFLSFHLKMEYIFLLFSLLRMDIALIFVLGVFNNNWMNLVIF